jgi:hypothetical protein
MGIPPKKNAIMSNAGRLINLIIAIKNSKPKKMRKKLLSNQYEKNKSLCTIFYQRLEIAPLQPVSSQFI